MPQPTSETWIPTPCPRQASVMRGGLGRQHKATNEPNKVPRNGNRQEQKKQQQQPIEHALSRMSVRWPKSMSRNGNSQGYQSSGAGHCGSVVGGHISKFYDVPAADENDTLESSGGANHRRSHPPRKRRRQGRSSNSCCSFPVNLSDASPSPTPTTGVTGHKH